jgi:hypothetical protein
MSALQKLLISSLIVLNSTYAVSTPVYLQEGFKAPYTGYLFTEEDTKGIRLELLEKDALVKINASFKTENTLLKESLDFRNQQVKQLLEEYNSMETRKYLYVAGGVLATIITIYAATKVVQATR